MWQARAGAVALQLERKAIGQPARRSGAATVAAGPAVALAAGDGDLLARADAEVSAATRSNVVKALVDRHADQALLLALLLAGMR